MTEGSRRRAVSLWRDAPTLTLPSAAGIKWIERGRVSDGTTPPQRHSIYYEVGASDEV